MANFREISSIAEEPMVDLFMPHPHFSDEINGNICQSEIEGGVFLDRLPLGAVMEMETQNRIYRLVNCGDHQVLMSGHPQICPEPVLVDIRGSTWGRTASSMIKLHFIGRGMHLEFHHPGYGVAHTSRIQEIRELPQER